MAKNNNNILKICCAILVILTLSFAYLYISSNAENSSLQEKANALDEIMKYQEGSLSQIAKAQETTANLDDYYEKWGQEEVGSISEQRYLERYKEELDKLRLIVDDNNKFQRDNSVLLSKYLGTNAEELVTSNNLLYTTYEDGYYIMLNYVE